MPEPTPAAELIDHLPPADQCRTLLSRGLAFLSGGELRAASADLRRCAGIAAAHGLAGLEARARHTAGYVDFLAGDLVGALQSMATAAGIGADGIGTGEIGTGEIGAAGIGAAGIGAEVPRGGPLLDRARVLVEAGLIREADEALAEADASFAGRRLSREQAEVDLVRAECALLDGDLLATRRHAMRARTRFDRLADHRKRRTAELLILQADVARGRTGARLEQRGRRLATELAADGQPAQSRAARLVVAEALLGRGLLPDARAAIESIGPARPTDPVITRLHTRYLHGRLAQEAGDLAAATRAVRAGLADLAGHQARFGSLELRTATAVHGRRLAELGVLVAVGHGRADAVFAASERGRTASSRRPAVRAPADEQVAELLGRLRHVVEMARAGDGDPATRQGQRRDLERRIVAQAQAGTGSTTRPASLSAVRAAVASTGSTLVTYSQAGDQLHAVVIGARGTVVRRLGRPDEAIEALRRVRADLDALARSSLPGALRTTTTASLRAGLARLDEVLLASLRRPGSRLVVVPTGALGAVPWGLLPSLRGVPVTVAPSATAWLTALPAAEAGSVVAEAGSVVAEAGSVVALAGPGLVRAEPEVAAVADAYPGVRSLTGDAATSSALRAALAAAGVVHVAAQGRHQTGNPLFSSIRLADRPLFVYELDRAAPHVVLSAGEPGPATIRPRDDALGLTGVLLQLGSRCVVAGVARVHDEVAADVMARYHRGLAAGQDSAAALAGALPDRLDYPAPFGCFGAQWQRP